MEVKINKEIAEYQESIFFGLSIRQFVCSLLALGTAVGTYFLLQLFTGRDLSWLCILAALPFALCGFFRYNGMPAEQFLLTLIRFYRTPSRLVYRSDNIFARCLGVRHD